MTSYLLIPMSRDEQGLTTGQYKMQTADRVQNADYFSRILAFIGFPCPFLNILCLKQSGQVTVVLK